MLGWLVKRRLASFQKEFNYDPRYVLDILAASPWAFSAPGCPVWRRIVKKSQKMPGPQSSWSLHWQKTAARVPNSW